MFIDGFQISGVTSDSRKVKKNFVFVAIEGEKFDGNNFIQDAINRGAVLVYTEKAIIHNQAVIKQIPDARKKLTELCNAFYDYPGEKLKVIGVTGTNGKTTTTTLIYEILKNSGVPVGLIGTLNIRIKEKIIETSLTTPPPEDIFYYLSQMVQEGVKVVVMEVSSHGLKNERVHQINFDIAIHTNIEKDHLNFHKTFDDYVASKKKLFDQLAPGNIGIINIDDSNSLKLLENNQDIVVLTYGLNKRSSITASSINVDTGLFFNYSLQRGITTLSGIEIDPFEYPIQLNLLGGHNVYNALAAISCCLLLDISIEKIAKAIKVFKSLSRRMEVIYQGDYLVIDDYSHNPASYEAVFESVQGIQYRNLNVVCAIRGNRGIEINRDNAMVLRQWSYLLNINSLIITGSYDYTGINDRVDPMERDCFLAVLEEENISYLYEDKLERAIELIKQQLNKNDLVLLLGSQGMDRGKEIWLRDLENTEFSMEIEKSHFMDRYH